MKIVEESEKELHVFPKYNTCGMLNKGELGTISLKKIIFNQKACIVFWEDDTKTVVKRKENDKFDKYAAVAQAIAKHQYGSTSAFHKMVDSVSVSHVMTKLKD